ncbi:MAG TPA: preprotein translocase subunit SecG [Thiotrichales bacterium]|nr:preprotein translocase subunit SecG [Thiotrichales bacterium]
MHTILIVLEVLVALALIGLILIQHGKGADAGAAFGSGASATVFGARGASSFLSRMTAGLATAFFVISMTLAVLASRQAKDESLVEKVSEPPPATAPVAEIPADVPADVPSPAEGKGGSPSQQEGVPSDVPPADVPAAGE